MVQSQDVFALVSTLHHRDAQGGRQRRAEMQMSSRQQSRATGKAAADGSGRERLCGRATRLVHPAIPRGSTTTTTMTMVFLIKAYHTR